MTQIKAATSSTTTTLQETCPATPNLTDRQREKLQYLRAMIGQLAAMAEAENAHLIGYMLGIAYIETGDVLKGERPLSLPTPKAIADEDNYQLQVLAAEKIARFLRVG